MSREHPNDPLHGVTLKALLEELVERYGWDELAERVPLACFSNLPSISSSLRFLRKTDWAREKLERLYIQDLRRMERNAKRNRRRAAMRANRFDPEEAGEADTPQTRSPPEAPSEADDRRGDGSSA